MPKKIGACARYCTKIGDYIQSILGEIFGLKVQLSC